jgi:hypothetical protein
VDRVFHPQQKVIVKKPYQSKLELPGKEATVISQLNKSVVEVDDGERRTTISSANISPLPMDIGRKRVHFQEEEEDFRSRLRPRPKDLLQRYKESRRGGM